MGGIGRGWETMNGGEGECGDGRMIGDIEREMETCTCIGDCESRLV